MDESTRPIRHAVGVMTGTSIDGIDAALVRIEGRGLGMCATLVRHHSEPLGDLQPRLRAAANQQPMAAGEFARLEWGFGVLHADVITRLLSKPGAGSMPTAPSLISIHGQTVFHQPPISWQLVNPAPIAARFACPVVSDLRQADLAHGGQGAPITPIADWILFRDTARTRAIVNLGGFCNVTVLPRDSGDESPAVGGNPRTHTTCLGAIRGFDVCACNQLLDVIAREVLGKPFDDHGASARRGQASPHAAAALHAMLERQHRGGRSLGTGDEASQWIHAIRSTMSPDDLAATAVWAIAHTILTATREHDADELILAGGGARNLALRDALRHLGHAEEVRIVDVRTSEEFGVPIEAREAMCFAVLGALCQDQVPITLPQVTGCGTPSPISGTWTFG